MAGRQACWLGCTLTVLVLACAGPAAAAPDGARKKPPPVALEGFTVTDVDAQGNPTGRTSGTGGALSVQESAGGCRTVDYWRTSTTLLGFVAYRFHQTKHWCWSYPRITSVSVGTYMSDVDANYHFRGIVSSQGWFYTWRGSDRGGHYSSRQALVENCVLWFPCSRREYPWVQIWVNGNGAWTASSGQ